MLNMLAYALLFNLYTIFLLIWGGMFAAITNSKSRFLYYTRQTGLWILALFYILVFIIAGVKGNRTEDISFVMAYGIIVILFLATNV